MGELEELRLELATAHARIADLESAIRRYCTTTGDKPVPQWAKNAANELAQAYANKLGVVPEGEE